MPLTGEVRRSPEPSARPSAAADSKERQICTRGSFAESAGVCLCFLRSCAVYKDNAVGNAIAVVSLSLHHAQAQYHYEEKRSHESFADKRRKTRVKQELECAAAWRGGVQHGKVAGITSTCTPLSL